MKEQEDLSQQLQKLVKKVALLEFENEQLVKELHTIQEILFSAGFPQGVKDIQDAMSELNGIENKDNDDNEP